MRKVFPFLLSAWVLSGQVTTKDLRDGPDRNWLTYIGDYFAQRHSPLKQIDTNNVSHLVPKWVRHFDSTGDLETVPLVYDGVMYATNSNEVYALDAVTGRKVWHYRALGAQRRAANRGVAMSGERVFLVTGDCHLISLRRTSGWILGPGVRAAERRLLLHGRAACSQRQSHRRRCLVGPFLLRRRAAAVDGKEAWRVWAVPRKGEAGSETWGSFPLIREADRLGPPGPTTPS